MWETDRGKPLARGEVKLSRAHSENDEGGEDLRPRNDRCPERKWERILKNIFVKGLRYLWAKQEDLREGGWSLGIYKEH